MGLYCIFNSIGRENKVRILRGNAFWPLWSADSGQLYHLSLNGWLWPRAMEVNLKLLNRLKNLIFVNDEKFLIYYQKTRAKGLLKFIVTNASIYIIVMIIVAVTMNIISCGFVKEGTLLTSLTIGLISGIVVSLLQWVMDNDRYSQIKKKNESSPPV